MKKKYYFCIEGMNAPFMREFLNEVQKLRIIEHRDRLTRFQYNFIEKMFNSYGVEIIHIEKNDVSEQEDLVTDIISLMASFSGKVYGKRSAERRKKKKEVKKCENSCGIE